MNTYEVEEYNVVRKESLPVTLVVKHISSIQIVSNAIVDQIVLNKFKGETFPPLSGFGHESKYAILFNTIDGKTFYKYFDKKEEAEKEYNVLRKMLLSS